MISHVWGALQIDGFYQIQAASPIVSPPVSKSVGIVYHALRFDLAAEQRNTSGPKRRKDETGPSCKRVMGEALRIQAPHGFQGILGHRQTLGCSAAHRERRQVEFEFL